MVQGEVQKLETLVQARGLGEKLVDNKAILRVRVEGD